MTNRLPPQPEDTPNEGGVCSLVAMEVERCNDMVLTMAAKLRAFVYVNKDEDPVMQQAWDVLREHEDVFDPSAYERGERGSAALLFLRLGALLERHPLAGRLLEQLMEAESKIRARTIHIIRQSEKLGEN